MADLVGVQAGDGQQPDAEQERRRGETIIHQHDSARHHSVCSGSRSWGISSGKAALHEEIRRSVAELFDVALQSRASIAVQGAPERHPEGADGPDDG